MMMTNPNDDMLDDLFASARAQTTQPSDELMARVLADAVAVQSAQSAFADAAPPGLWDRMLDVLGGWPAISGLAAATVAGVWIGVAPPSTVQDLTADIVGDEVSVGLWSPDFGFETGDIIDG